MKPSKIIRYIIFIAFTLLLVSCRKDSTDANFLFINVDKDASCLLAEVFFQIHINVLIWLYVFSLTYNEQVKKEIYDESGQYVIGTVKTGERRKVGPLIPPEKRKLINKHFHPVASLICTSIACVSWIVSPAKHPVWYGIILTVAIIYFLYKYYQSATFRKCTQYYLIPYFITVIICFAVYA